MAVDQLASLTLKQMGKSGMTIADLADRADVAPSSLSLWLSGRRSIRLLSALRVMRAVGIYLTTEDPHGRGRFTPTSPNRFRAARPLRAD